MPWPAIMDDDDGDDDEGETQDRNRGRSRRNGGSAGYPNFQAYMYTYMVYVYVRIDQYVYITYYGLLHMYVCMYFHGFCQTDSSLLRVKEHPMISPTYDAASLLTVLPLSSLSPM